MSGVLSAGTRLKDFVPCLNGKVTSISSSGSYNSKKDLPIDTYIITRPSHGASCFQRFKDVLNVEHGFQQLDPLAQTPSAIFQEYINDKFSNNRIFSIQQCANP